MMSSPEVLTTSPVVWDFQPVTFGLGAEPDLFGWYHPAQGGARDCGVVLCNPFAYDLLGTHRSYRVLAEQLAAAGFPVLRFDYHGTGDSAGSDADPERVATWLGNISTAIDQLKQLAGVPKVALFGLRLSASFALMVAEGRSDISALMLWAPVINGRHVVRELKLLHSTSAALAARQEGETAASGDTIEAAGFRHTQPTLLDIGKIDLLKRPCPSVANIALLSRDEAKPDAALLELWAAGGLTPTVFDLPGYAGMLRDPHVATVPQLAIEALVQWLGDLHGTRAASVAPHIPTTPKALLTSAGESSVLLHERPLRFGARQQLFGVVSAPATQAPDAIAAIFINAGGNHRVGPSRLTVPLARHIASLGHTVLRMDIAGFGDSIKLEGPLPIFQLSSVPDVREAIDQLAVLHGSPFKHYVVVGLCSGGFLAHHTALQDARVTSQMTLNLPSFEWKGPSDGESIEEYGHRNIKPLGFYAAALFAPQTWKRLFSGGINLRLIADVGGKRLLSRVQVKLQQLLARFKPGVDNSVAGQFAALSKRGVKSVLILSANDGAVDEMETHLGKNAVRMSSDPNFSYLTIEGADHTFTAERCRREVFDIIRQHFASLSR